MAKLTSNDADDETEPRRIVGWTVGVSDYDVTIEVGHAPPLDARLHADIVRRFGEDWLANECASDERIAAIARQALDPDFWERGEWAAAAMELIARIVRDRRER